MARSRAVLVTGSSRGIGAAIARAFVAAGDRVAIHSRGGGPAGIGEVHLAADLSDRAAARRLVDEAAEALGGLDVVINNAGIYLPHPPLTTPQPQWQQAFDATLAVNLLAPADIMHAAIPHLRASGGGAIVNVSSRGAFRGEPDNPAYAASKAGLNSLSQSMALSLAPLGISVSVVAPGFVETDMAASHLEGPLGDGIRAQSPFGRVAKPEEVAEAVLWLASPGALFASGTIIDVNGASYLRS